jgi:hypothetical protein
VSDGGGADSIFWFRLKGRQRDEILLEDKVEATSSL